MLVKTVKQSYRPYSELMGFMETFRGMVNQCITIGLEENRRSMKSLSKASYSKLRQYQITTAYKLCAISRAAGILTNYRKLLRDHHVEIPYCRRASLVTAACYGLRVKKSILNLPGKIKIELSPHTVSVLDGTNIRSVTLTPDSLNIAYSKEIAPVKTTGLLAIDRNLDNVTMADTAGKTSRNSLDKETLSKALCRMTKSRFHRNDARIRRYIYGKYGRIERNRVNPVLHNASASIVRQAKQNSLGIVLENIKGIRKLYRRGNSQNRHYRFRMNAWSFYEFQRQLSYKARWEGLPVHYVSPRGTSSKCSKCGDQVFAKESRIVECPRCGCIDRDVNAARNVLSAALRFRVKGPPSEAMVEEREPDGVTLILKVDGGQSS